MEEEHGGRKLLGEKERERKREREKDHKGLMIRYTLQRHTPLLTYFLDWNSFPNSLFSYEPMDGLISHYPITSQ
jgi:hypothetical protein